MYNKIENPLTGKKVDVNSKKGRNILKNFLMFTKQSGGSGSVTGSTPYWLPLHGEKLRKNSIEKIILLNPENNKIITASDGNYPLIMKDYNPFDIRTNQIWDIIYTDGFYTIIDFPKIHSIDAEKISFWYDESKNKLLDDYYRDSYLPDESNSNYLMGYATKVNGEPKPNQIFHILKIIKMGAVPDIPVSSKQESDTLPSEDDKVNKLRVVYWNLEKWLGAKQTDYYHKGKNKIYTGDESALASSNLHPDENPDAWDVLVLIESGQERINNLQPLLKDKRFDYAHAVRSDMDLGILIIWKTMIVQRSKLPEVIYQTSSFAYLAVPLEKVKSPNSKLWVGGVHLKSGDSFDISQHPIPGSNAAIRKLHVEERIAYPMNEVLKSSETNKEYPSQYIIGGDFNSIWEGSPKFLQSKLLGESDHLPKPEHFTTQHHTTHVAPGGGTWNNPQSGWPGAIDHVLISTPMKVIDVTPIKITDSVRFDKHVDIGNENMSYAKLGTPIFKDNKKHNVSDHVPIQFTVQFT
tara:strand:- start:4642 stop:6204 length:1563 start_codon:yes stop_codon:yes gene_type:complete